MLATVLTCTDLDAMSRFLVDDLGLRIDTISPADDPREIVLSGRGAVVCLRRGDVDVPGHLLLYDPDRPAGAAGEQRCAPNGTVIEVRTGSTEVDVPENQPTLSVVTADPADTFGAGRAGMGYRDLLPDRWGGRFIASHIVIPDGGEVADYVHFHRIRFQMIFVASGWVDVVYEDQGEPFRMSAGDCVLQPPEIRHRVLRSSPGLEVIEVSCPAEHATVAEHSITLPTGSIVPDREFGGQRFVRHVAAKSKPTPWIVPGLRGRDTGIASATGGDASASVLETDHRLDPTRLHIGVDSEFVLLVGLAGEATLDIELPSATSIDLRPRDAVALPPGARWRWASASADHESLLVELPERSVAADP